MVEYEIMRLVPFFPLCELSLQVCTEYRRDQKITMSFLSDSRAHLQHCNFQYRGDFIIEIRMVRKI